MRLCVYVVYVRMLCYSMLCTYAIVCFWCMLVMRGCYERMYECNVRVMYECRLCDVCVHVMLCIDDMFCLYACA